MSTDIALHPLLEVVLDHAADPALLDRLEPAPEVRTRLRLLATNELELWLISWPPGTHTGWHDHGSSAGAFTVLRGNLVELTFPGALQMQPLGVGHARSFGAGHAHDLRNESRTPALSLHAYGPRLATMTRFAFRGDRLDPLGVERGGEEA
jgi:predicted metal-dependent enzyme (double-stranded beta helix superfamily)